MEILKEIAIDDICDCLVFVIDFLQNELYRYKNTHTDLVIEPVYEDSGNSFIKPSLKGLETAELKSKISTKI